MTGTVSSYLFVFILTGMVIDREGVPGNNVMGNENCVSLEQGYQNDGLAKTKNLYDQIRTLFFYFITRNLYSVLKYILKIDDILTFLYFIF